MKNSSMSRPAVTLIAAAVILGQPYTAAAQQPPSPAQPAVQGAADPDAAQRREILQQMRPLRSELQSLQQRVAARYPGDIPPEQIEERIEDIQQKLQPLQRQLEQLGPAPGGRGGFGGSGFGGPGGQTGPITPPADATPARLREIIDQQNRQIARLQAAARQQGPVRTEAPRPCEPVNPNATPEARALLKKLCDVTGNGILTGQHNFPNHRSIDTEAVATAAGKYPAIWGSDFGFLDGEDKDAITHRDLMIEEAKRQHTAGSIIYFCWHMLRPTEDEPGKADPAGGSSDSWRGSVQARLTEEQWQELIASDSPLHRRWEKYMDTAAGYLKQLQDARIPVLWRPMHENNGSFFWWGGRPGPYGTAMLFRELYNRMTYVHQLNNLVWVWNQNGPAPGGEFYDYFPGPAYCDVVSYDNYRSLEDRYYWEILTIANGKPIGLGEVGGPPSAEVVKSQPRWSFFMPWASGSGQVRNAESWKHPYFLFRGDPIPAN